MGESREYPVWVLPAVFVAVAGVFGFILWRSSVPAHHPGHGAILIDLSDSRQKVCAQVAAIVQKDLSDPAMGPGATVTLFTLGSPATANEPVQRGTFTLPAEQKTMEGPDAKNIKQNELVKQITARCEELPETTVTPLFLDMKRVVEFLQQLDQRPDAYLTLHAITDGEETEVKEIKQALNMPPKSKIEFPAVINNDRVRVEICGMAETIGTVTVGKGKKEVKTRTRDPLRADRGKEVWENAFTDQKLVHINPYCLTASTEAKK